MDEYFLYVDEAGDEGFGKLRKSDSGGQSRWLLLGAILVRKQNDSSLPAWRDEVMELFPRKRQRDLHFKHLKHEQRVAAAKLLGQKRMGVCVVCSDKTTIPHLPPHLLAIYKRKGHLYNYMVRFLLERATAACASVSLKAGNGAKLYVTFSKRAGTDYEVMRDYLYLMRDGKEVLRPVRSIDWDVLHPEDIRVENHSKRAGLQIADIVTSSTYAALEPNLYGDVELRYASLLKERYLIDGGGIPNCGVTFIPKAASRRPHSLALMDEVCGPLGPVPRR